MTSRERFYECFYKIVNEKNNNSVYLSAVKFNEIVSEIKNVRSSGIKSNKAYRILKRYDLITIREENKLILLLLEGNTNILYYITNENIYDVLHDVYLSIGHGGKHRMNAEVKKNKGLVIKLMVFSEMNSRCQVDLIDMHTQGDGEFWLIMVYQDHLTKFVQLRPLKTKRAEEVAKHLIDIFCIFGAPMILQSDNDREFVNKIIEDLKEMWDTLKIVHRKPRHTQSQGSVERANQDIQNMLITWMKKNNCKSWSEGLRFVQLMKNMTYHDGIKRSPYMALFSTDVKIGLSSLLPAEAVEKLTTEQELEEILQSVVSDYEQKDDHNVSDKDVNC
ncbi:KRAB-A domain-containing protein 2-like [Rhopalosiphum maidis]|uniref:KRAB-A domain-containing protein 2-like n=1 Tax=Rhopalosiphum maidis TaxID=43146 RepID=UPI000EFFDD06|nr:KRAB-A domain-containing protein 2-like [Rhopalosiphum maidis]